MYDDVGDVCGETDHSSSRVVGYVVCHMQSRALSCNRTILRPSYLISNRCVENDRCLVITGMQIILSFLYTFSKIPLCLHVQQEISLLIYEIR